MTLKEKAKTLPEWHKELRKKGEVDCGACSVIGTKDACSDCAEILGMHPKLVRIEDAEADKREALEKVAWYCPCCEEWHRLDRTCAVYEIWKVREERAHR